MGTRIFLLHDACDPRAKMIGSYSSVEAAQYDNPGPWLQRHDAEIGPYWEHSPAAGECYELHPWPWPVAGVST